METIEHIIKQPKERKYKTPLLFQHGAWHGAWCWDLWMNYFASLGYEAHAISLPGHGNSSLNKGHINFYTLKDYVDILAGEIEKVSPKPVVIGHSLGGAILQRYLENHQLPGAVLLATLPSSGMFQMMVRFTRRHPLDALIQILTLNLSFKAPEIAQELFLNPKTKIDVPAFHKRLVRESLGPQRLMYPLTKVNAEKTPVLVVGAENDIIFSIAEQESTAKKYNGKCVIIKNQAHNLMMESAWQETADVINAWLVMDLKL
jgi:pimeloyl-ACP methyl ester carboxylesterase